jgi:hypothetical protein
MAQKQLRPIEKSSDEKVKKRENGVCFIRSTAEFQRYQEQLQDGLVTRIAEPDPTDFTVSKRQWERQVQHWRKELVELEAVADGLEQQQKALDASSSASAKHLARVQRSAAAAMRRTQHPPASAAPAASTRRHGTQEAASAPGAPEAASAPGAPEAASASRAPEAASA